MLKLVDLSLDIYDHAPTFGPDPKTAVLPHMGIANMGYITVHLIRLRPEVLVIEGLTGLDRLRSEQVLLLALPLRIRGRDGSPCRAMAIDADSPAELSPLLQLLDALEYAPL